VRRRSRLAAQLSPLERANPLSLVAVEAHVDAPPADRRAAQRLDHLVRGRGRHLDEREAVPDADRADVAARNAGLVRDRADEITRAQPVETPRTDEDAQRLAETTLRRAFFERTALAAVETATLRTLARVGRRRTTVGPEVLLELLRRPAALERRTVELRAIELRPARATVLPFRGRASPRRRRRP
jgi:hypothetical protein